MRSPLFDFPPTSIWHRLNHGVLQDIDLDFETHTDLNDLDTTDVPIARRLLTAFRAALAFEEAHVAHDHQPSSGLWAVLREAKHKDFYALAERQDVEAFARCLSNALREDVCFGLGPGPGVSKIMCEPGSTRDDLFLSIFDNLVSCAEGLGALPAELVETGSAERHLHRGIKPVVEAIESTLGRQIGRPQVMGMTGIVVGGRVIDNRLPDDLYCASRLSTIGQAFRRTRICEIGGGFGGLADEAFAAGTTHYQIADLPVINVIQAYFLMKTRGASQVNLFGESNKDAVFDVIPYWQFYEKDRFFDLVVNRDSMAEMPLGAATSYLREIASRGAAFLSVNQEGTAPTGDGDIRHLSVPNVAKQFAGLIRVGRHRYWTRPGYVEELYLPA